MKKRIGLPYVGYAISALLVALIALADFSAQADLALGVAFAAIFSVSHTQLLHRKMMCEEKDYRVEVMDERNILIKEKAGNLTNLMTVTLLGVATVLFIALDYIVPAIVTGAIVCLQPLILIFFSNRLEKKL